MRTPASAAEHGLGAALRRLHRNYIRVLQLRLAEHGVSVAQYLHLRALWEEAGLTQNEVSQRLGIEKASSTAVLESLERNGLIHRVRDEADRRKVRVFLSDGGEQLRAVLMPFAKQVANRASQGLTEAELETFFVTIDRMLDNLRDVGSTDGEKSAPTGHDPPAQEAVRPGRLTRRQSMLAPSTRRRGG